MSHGVRESRRSGRGALACLAGVFLHEATIPFGRHADRHLNALAGCDERWEGVIAIVIGIGIAIGIVAARVAIVIVNGQLFDGARELVEADRPIDEESVERLHAAWRVRLIHWISSDVKEADAVRGADDERFAPRPVESYAVVERHPTSLAFIVATHD